MRLRLSLPGSSAPPNASNARLRIHNAIHATADYAFKVFISVALLERFVHPLFSAPQFVRVVSNAILGYFVVKIAAAPLLFGRAARSPRWLARVAEGVAPLPFPTVLIAAILCLLSGAVGWVGMEAAFVQLMKPSYSDLAITVLIAGCGGLLALGSGMSVYRSLFSRTASGKPSLVGSRRAEPRVPKESVDFTLLPQGPLANAILVDEAALASANLYDVIEANVTFVNWALFDARLIPGEFPREALLSYHVDYYLWQVNNGGHAQFALNSELPEGTVTDIENGLREMGATDYLAIFEKFLALMRSTPELARYLAERREMELYGSSAMKELNDEFFALRGKDRLVGQNAAWLRDLPVLLPLPADELAAEKDAIKAKNHLLAARRAGATMRREQLEAGEPTYVAASRLCAAVGITCEGLIAGAREPDGAVIWGIRTSGGTHIMRLRSDCAEIFALGRAEALAMIRMVD